MSEIVRLEGVSRDFKVGSTVVHALSEVNATVESGKLQVLRGRSGSGKTTLLNIVGMLDKPTAGKVYIDGQEVTALSERQRTTIRRKNLGYVFQSVALISYMTAFENVEFILKMRGYPKNQIKSRTEEVLTFVGLHKRMNHRAFEMSGGEQQRVAIARAFAQKPTLLLADEPTAELDSKMGLQVIKIFRELVEKEGASIIMTSHDPSILEVADNVITLEDGKVIS